MKAVSLELLFLFAAPVSFELAEYFSWGAGVYRFMTLFALFACVAFAGARGATLESRLIRGRLYALVIAATLVLLAAHVRVFVRDIERGYSCLTDMGRPSICAGEWLLRKLNPWAECAPREPGKKKPRDKVWAFCLADGNCIDPKYGGTYGRWSHHGTGFDFMDGYKYGPLMPLAYLPLTHRYLERGLYLVHFAWWFALLALCASVARAAYPQVRAVSWRTLLVLLLPAALPVAQLFPDTQIKALGRSYELSPPDPMMFVRQLTYGCSNDVIPIVLVLAAILVAARGRSFAAGVLCGLSFAAKQLPAPLIALVLVGMNGVRPVRFVLGAVLAASAFYLPVLFWAPRELIANLVLFGVARPTNSSSIRRYLPAGLEPLVSIAQLACVALLAWRFYRRSPRNLGACLETVTLVLIAFVALNKIVHGNYFLWLEPFVALVLAGAPFAPSEPAARVEVSSS